MMKSSTEFALVYGMQNSLPGQYLEQLQAWDLRNDKQIYENEYRFDID